MRDLAEAIAVLYQYGILDKKTSRLIFLQAFDESLELTKYSDQKAN